MAFRVGPFMAQRTREAPIWRLEIRKNYRNGGWLCLFSRRDAFVPVSGKLFATECPNWNTMGRSAEDDRGRIREGTVSFRKFRDSPIRYVKVLRLDAQDDQGVALRHLSLAVRCGYRNSGVPRVTSINFHVKASDSCRSLVSLATHR